MPRVPTSICFVCESCGKTARPGRIRRWFGRCGRCDGRSWTLAVKYTETEREFSPSSLFASLLSPWRGLCTVRVFTNQVVARAVSDEVAVRLTQDRWRVRERVAEYLRRRGQADLQAQGAEKCAACDALFVPAEEKPWTKLGYCSKACRAEAGAAVESTPAPTAPGPQAGRSVRVTCPSGHGFEVNATYSGCIRRCPEYGEKCSVP